MKKIVNTSSSRTDLLGFVDDGGGIDGGDEMGDLGIIWSSSDGVYTWHDIYTWQPSATLSYTEYNFPFGFLVT